MFGFRQHFHETLCTLSVFTRKEGMSNSFGSRTSRPSNSVDVIFDSIDTCRHVIIDDNSNILDVKSWNNEKYKIDERKKTRVRMMNGREIILSAPKHDTSTQ